MEPLLNPIIKSPELTHSTPNNQLLNELRFGAHSSVIHSARSHRSNDGISNYENDANLSTEEKHDRDRDRDRHSEIETTITTRTGAVFDDLEFLHDFLEHESKKPFFESNCFKINCKNLCIFGTISTIIGCLLYVIYYYFGDSIDQNYVEILRLASIPIICIIFTYGHIALALWMTFWPTHFFPTKHLQFASGPFAGYGLGWQGIVPMKAVKMAQIAVDLMVPDVVRMEDVVAKIDPVVVSSIIEPALYEILKILIPRIAAKQAPIGWALLPSAMKEKMISVALADSHKSVAAMIRDINENIEEMFDLTQFITAALRNDKQLLSQIFLKCGRKELIFIRNFGAVMGLLFGLTQMLANIYFSGNVYFNHLMLPISGFILGFITNWIALKLIFRPIDAIVCGPIKIQGLFLKRQREVSVEFAALITKKILTAQNILESLYRGPSSDKLFIKITKHLQDACDRFAGYEKFKPLIEYALGTDKYNQVKQEIIDGLFNCLELKCKKEILAVQKNLEQYTDETMDIERLLRTKMAALTSKQFEGVLHPVFEEDEIKLILIGAVLGLIVGLFQVYVIKN